MTRQRPDRHDELADAPRRRGLLIGLTMALGLGLPASVANGQDARLIQDRPTIHVSEDHPWPTPPVTTPTHISASMRSLVAMLGSSNFQEREMAATELAAIARDRADLYAVLMLDELDSEQRFRLLDVLHDRIVDRPRGALGIRMQAVPRRNGVRVTELLPGMPAALELRLRDVIIAVDGQPVRTDDDLIRKVQQHAPGDMIQLTVRREIHDEQGLVRRDEHGSALEELRDLSIRLASAESLRDPRTGQPQAGPYVRELTEESRAARANYAPRPRLVRVRNFPDGASARVP